MDNGLPVVTGGHVHKFVNNLINRRNVRVHLGKRKSVIRVPSLSVFLQLNLKWSAEVTPLFYLYVFPSFSILTSPTQTLTALLVPTSLLGFKDSSGAFRHGSILKSTRYCSFPPSSSSLAKLLCGHHLILGSNGVPPLPPMPIITVTLIWFPTNYQCDSLPLPIQETAFLHFMVSSTLVILSMVFPRWSPLSVQQPPGAFFANRSMAACVSLRGRRKLTTILAYMATYRSTEKSDPRYFLEENHSMIIQ